MCKFLVFCLLYLSLLHNCCAVIFSVDEDIEIAQFAVYPTNCHFPTVVSKFPQYVEQTHKRTGEFNRQTAKMQPNFIPYRVKIQPKYSNIWQKYCPNVVKSARVAVNYTLSGCELCPIFYDKSLTIANNCSNYSTTSLIISPLISNITVVDNNAFAVWDVAKNTPLVDICQGYGHPIDIYIDRTSIIGGVVYEPQYYCTIPEPTTLILYLTGLGVLYIIAKDRKGMVNYKYDGTQRKNE